MESPGGARERLQIMGKILRQIIFTCLSIGLIAGCDVMMENRIGQNVRNELTGMGHKIEVKGTFSSDMGGGQAVLQDFAVGVNYGASDPRKDGQAVAEMPVE